MNDEQQIAHNLKINGEYLKLFEAALQRQSLSEKTIKKHLFNVDFYINEYLNYEGPNSLEEGWNQVDGYFDNWFIRKALWASPTTIKEASASIKKFYKFLATLNVISPEEFKDLTMTIKEEMPKWLELVEQYDMYDC